MKTDTPKQVCPFINLMELSVTGAIETVDQSAFTPLKSTQSRV